MISKQTIADAIKILAEAAHPAQVILFGSYARGEERDDSDVDILVIEQTLENRHEEIVRLRRALAPLKIPVDILVVSLDDFKKWSEAPSTTLYWAKREGKVLYESAA
jgi:predicted nucleotidyltransferase